MRILEFAVALSAGFLAAGSASAFVVVHNDTYEGAFQQTGLVQGATYYLRFESEIPVTEFEAIHAYRWNWDWYNGDGTPQMYGNDEPREDPMVWTHVDGAWQASFSPKIGYNIYFVEGGPFEKISYTNERLFMFYDIHHAEYTGMDWTLTFSDEPISPVPEPAAWALMILGFGVVGATLRAGRPTRSVAAGQGA